MEKMSIKKHKTKGEVNSEVWAYILFRCQEHRRFIKELRCAFPGCMGQTDGYIWMNEGRGWLPRRFYYYDYFNLYETLLYDTLLLNQDTSVENSAPDLLCNNHT